MKREGERRDGDKGAGTDRDRETRRDRNNNRYMT